ncbi:MAG: hypothetical protein R3304_07935 [Longimicrobiales bacterium]|nr:hypothetical protein [Longimicrobiales bacterium]
MNGSTGADGARTIHLLRMSDHALAVAAAMRHFDIAAEALPPPDDESLALGTAHCRGNECLPCLLTTGDMLKACREPGFDSDRSVFFMPTGSGPCRFGQYNVLQRAILDAEGHEGVGLITSSADDSYRLFGEHPTRLRMLSWQALSAVDLLTKVLHEYRPYEVRTGESDTAYEASLVELVEAVEAGGGRRLVGALESAAHRFGDVAVDRSESKPLVAILGEIYVMLNARANLNIIRSVEALGGEVMLGTFMDWLYFVDWRRRDLSFRFGRYRESFKAWLSDLYQHAVERRLLKPVAPLLRLPVEEPVAKVVKRLDGLYDPVLGTEAVLTIARIVELADHGVLAGAVNILPFSCLPGLIVNCMGPSVRDAAGGVPWLDVACDGQKETNLNTRLEAFMHQAREFHLQQSRPVSA